MDNHTFAYNNIYVLDMVLTTSNNTNQQIFSLANKTALSVHWFMTLYNAHDYKSYMKFSDQSQNHQTTKLKSLPNVPRM